MMKKSDVIKLTVLVMSLVQVSSVGATLVFSGSENMEFRDMALNTPEARRTKIHDCIWDSAHECEVSIHSGAGIHISATDSRRHITIRFSGTDRPYDACHIYETVDENGHNESRCFQH